MPVYEYHCKACKKDFTVTRSFAEYERKRVVKCPSCQGTQVEQLVGSVNLKTTKKS